MTSIAAVGLSKGYGSVKAIDDVSFDVAGGRICALAGPNGAGKSTLIGMLLGLIRPDRGSALFDGIPFADLAWPSQTVGALVDGAGVHPQRTAREHLRVVATAARLRRSRVSEVLEETGLTGVADQPVRTFSHGMRQRLRLACAQLGRPDVLILDEPANGLDPAGRRWLRDTLSDAARQRATVLVSTHDLAEAELLADEVVILSHGRVLAHGAVRDLTRAAVVEVASSRADALAAIASRHGYSVTVIGDVATIAAVHPEVVGQWILDENLIVREMHTRRRTLEDVFLTVTATCAKAERPAHVGFASRDR